jgi:hypothetical protein
MSTATSPETHTDTHTDTRAGAGVSDGRERYAGPEAATAR